MSNKHLFLYRLEDAWCRPISVVAVLNCQSENVICSYPCAETNRTRRKKDGSTKQVLTLKPEELEQIRRILRESKDVFALTEVESPLVLDGFLYDFYFSVDGQELRLRADNIWVYRQTESVRAKQILALFDRLAAVLLSAGVEEKYLQLDPEADSGQR